MEALLRLAHISKNFSLRGNRKIQALCDINLDVYQRETLGIVGESGCGKSTLARVIMGVYPAAEGQVYFHGQALDLSRRKGRLAFAEKVQMIFQDPYTSLNPRMKVEDIVAENLLIHHRLGPKERKKRVSELLDAVGLQAAHAGRFPGEFSGGQRQRIGIARALALNPELLVCDEPISALDVSIQSQIMNLLKRLGQELGLTYIFIAHDLNMVYYISSRVAVMYLGHIVELAKTEELRQQPMHPYTRLLGEAVLKPDPDWRPESDAWIKHDEVQQAQGTPAGCPFARRCPKQQPLCLAQAPQLQELAPAHWAACHYPCG